MLSILNPFEISVTTGRRLVLSLLDALIREAWEDDNVMITFPNAEMILIPKTTTEASPLAAADPADTAMVVPEG